MILFFTLHSDAICWWLCTETVSGDGDQGCKYVLSSVEYLLSHNTDSCVCDWTFVLIIYIQACNI